MQLMPLGCRRHAIPIIQSPQLVLRPIFADGMCTCEARLAVTTMKSGLTDYRTASDEQ